MYGVNGYVDADGPMPYWEHQGDLYRRVATYVETTKALGLTIPSSLLLRADQVIE